jgi:hypothetical protein
MAGGGGMALAGNLTRATVSVMISSLGESGVASCAKTGATPPTSIGRTTRRANERSHG